MKRWVVLIALIFSMSSFANEISEGQVIQGSQDIYNAITTAHPEFLNQYCLAYHVRQEADYDVLIASGFHIQSFSFSKTILTVNNEPRNAMHVVVTWTTSAGNQTETNFNCLLKQ